MRFLLQLLTIAGVVFVGVSASAQQEAPEPPPVEELDDTPTKADEEDSASEEGGEQTDSGVEPFSVRRAGVEVVTGAGLMVSGSLMGGLTGLVVAGGNDGLFRGDATAGFAVGAAIGYLVGTPLGVWVGGNAMDGNGALWAAATGTVAGVAAGGGLTALISSSTGGSGGAEFWLTALPLTGAIVGYELSSGPVERPSDGAASFRFGVSPTARGRGALMNVSGRW